jgi:heat shock protein HtpX
MPFKTVRNLRVSLAWLDASANPFQAGVLLAAFGALLALALWPELGALAALIALLAVAAVVGLALRLPPGAVMRLYGARAHEPASLKQVDALVAELAQRAALPRSPALFVVPSTMLAAFSVGTLDRSAIAITEGLLRQLTMREIAAVIAREVSHIGLSDLFALSVADFVTRFAQALYYLGLGLGALNLWRLLTDEELVSWWTVILLVLMPLLLNLLQLALPRAREFAADRTAALMTGDPLGVAAAVSRCDPSTGAIWDDLLPPVPARKVPQPSMLRCPPAAAKRIDRLNALQTPPMPPLDVEEGPRISLIGLGPIAMRPRYRWPGVWF